MTELAEHGSAWVSAHAFFHGDLDRLLTQVVAPLTAELAAEFFFLRYWDGGPHLRLRVLPPGGVAREDVQRLIGERFGRFFARHPSPDRVSAADYAAFAPLLARRENLPTWNRRLHPNNSVAFIEYRREHDRYGHSAAMRAVERHFAESSRIAMRVVTLGAPPTRRATLALGCLLASWFVGCGDPAGVRAWLGDRYRDTGRPDPATAGEFTRVIEVARTALNLAGDAATAGGAVAQWTRSMVTLRSVLLGAPAGGPERDDNARRVLDLCTHLLCNRLGVAPAAEGVLRRWAAEAATALQTQQS